MWVLLKEQDWSQQMIWWGNMTECIEHIMNANYYELHSEAFIIKEPSMRSQVWQHSDDC